MITNPIALILILVIVEISILFFSSRKQFEKYFHFIPPVFWIYFIPMMFSTFGIIDSKNPIYKVISETFLPASLIILLLSSDIKAILRLGPTALFMMFAGSLGIMIGMPLIFMTAKNLVGSHMWSGFGALSGSWIGGSANMIAVKEALGTPDNIFSSMVIVDTIVPYVWMGMLVACVGLQHIYDRWNKSDKTILNELNNRIDKNAKIKKFWTIPSIIMVLAIGAIGSFCATYISSRLPVVKDMISSYTWVIIIASLIGIALSFTSMRKLDEHHSSQIGYILLYFVLTTIGAKASLSNFGGTVLLIACGFAVVLIHAIFIIAAGRLFKAPMFLVATASQANIGGVASAPIVAALYEPELASVGLLLAILGNIVGTYLGILTGYFCHLAAG